MAVKVDDLLFMFMFFVIYASNRLILWRFSKSLLRANLMNVSAFPPQKTKTRAVHMEMIFVLIRLLSHLYFQTAVVLTVRTY